MLINYPKKLLSINQYGVGLFNSFIFKEKIIDFFQVIQVRNLD